MKTKVELTVLNSNTVDYCNFRHFIMNDVCSYLQAFKSDIYLDIVTFSKIRSNKTIWLFLRETGTDLVFKEKDFLRYAKRNYKCYQLDFLIDKELWCKIDKVTISEIDITDIEKI